jgi:hypothetical protein
MAIWLGHPVPAGYRYGDLAFQVKGVSVLGRSGQQTLLLVREGTLYEQTCSCLTAIEPGYRPRWVPDTMIDWLSDCRSSHDCDFVLQLSRDEFLSSV